MFEQAIPTTAATTNDGFSEASSLPTKLMCAAAFMRRPMLPRQKGSSDDDPTLYQVRRSRVSKVTATARPSAVGWAYIRLVRGRRSPTWAVSAAPGVDPTVLYRDCDFALQIVRLRNLCVAGTVAASLGLWPPATAIWLGVLLWWSLPLTRTLRWAPPLVAIAVLASELAKSGRSAQHWAAPGLALAVIWGFFALDAFAARIFIRSVLNRQTHASIARRDPQPHGKRLRAIVDEHEGVRVAYSGGRIVGAGEPEWTAPTSVKLAPPDQRTRPRSFTSDDLLQHIESKLNALRTASGTSHAIPGLEVDKVLVAPIGHEHSDEDSGSRRLHRSLVNRHVSGEPARVYVRARAVLWGGQVVPSVYIGAVPEGEILRFIFLPYTLHPVGPELSQARKVAKSHAVTWLPVSLWHGTLEVAGLCQSLHRSVQRTTLRALKIIQLDKLPYVDSDGATPKPGESGSSVHSLREIYGDETGDMHMLEDAARFIHILRIRVYDEALAFLHERGVDIGEFKQQVQSIINNVAFYGDVSGSNMQFIAAASASGNANVQGQSG